MMTNLDALHHERQSDYGPWAANMTGTSEQMQGLARQWFSNNPDKPLPPWWCPLMQVAVKMNRIASGNYKPDNFDDLRVYLKFVEEMQAKG
jgi:hypothetical protein